MRPLKYSIYKGMTGQWGALQFTLQYPHYYKEKQKDYTGDQALDGPALRDGWKERPGTIFMDITSTIDKNVYDWKNKITIAIGIVDAGKILHCLYTGQDCSIMHDPGAKSHSQGLVRKNLSVTSPKGTASGCMFKASQNAAGQKKSHVVPLTGDELIVLKELLSAAVPLMLQWK